MRISPNVLKQRECKGLPGSHCRRSSTKFHVKSLNVGSKITRRSPSRVIWKQLRVIEATRNNQNKLPDDIPAASSVSSNRRMRTNKSFSPTKIACLTDELEHYSRSRWLLKLSSEITAMHLLHAATFIR